MSQRWEAGAGLLVGEHFFERELSGFLGLDRAPAGWFGLPVERLWGVVLRALVH